MNENNANIEDGTYITTITKKDQTNTSIQNKVKKYNNEKKKSNTYEELIYDKNNLKKEYTDYQ